MSILDEKLSDVEKILSDPTKRAGLYNDIMEIEEIKKNKNKKGYEWARIVMLIGGYTALQNGEELSWKAIYDKYGMNLFYESTGAMQKGLGKAIYGETSCKIEEVEKELSKKFSDGTYDWNWTLRELINYLLQNEANARNSKPILNALLKIGGTYKLTKNGSVIKVTLTDPYTLLETNKQLIMNGAPGTGKTFSARNDVADKLFGSNGNKDIQMDMVQFHPSYDYTDFIEGIRPVMNTNTSVSQITGGSQQGSSGTKVTTGIGYTLKNGTFKTFCRRAGVIERLWAAKEDVTSASINDFLNGEDCEIKNFWNDWINNNTEAIDNLNEEIKKRREDTEFAKSSDSDTKLKSLELPAFLFIIDEINRAEISKVLGETMYCLDADYRGPKGMIATQYSSMATKESFFVDETNDKFFIPSNVYIIGTMNDIDRSVEVFDFALRRRFAWFEVMAEDVMEKVLEAMEVKKKLSQQLPSGKTEFEDYLVRIDTLNEAIEKKLKLNRHYHLGPSYFAKILLYLDSGYADACKQVWKNHISQILYEYVKGKRTENEIAVIENEFCN